MNLIKTIKCLCCLIKCSKYIYYIKKALCVATLVIAVFAIFGNIGKCKAIMQKFRVM